MRILLTNDDGIYAKGIQALWLELAEIGEVIVVAPDSEKSATSQAITVHHPIRVDRHKIEGKNIEAWKVGGTPTDCIKIAIEAILKHRPDVVISGINHGANLGTDVLYSGTVSAAVEGALYGIPSFAVSLDMKEHADFSTAAHTVRRLLEKLWPNQLKELVSLWNINVPDCGISNMQGLAFTRLGVRQYENIFEPRKDPRGRTYYWMGGEIIENLAEAGTDIAAIRANKISITPIQLDMTDYHMCENLQVKERLLGEAIFDFE